MKNRKVFLDLSVLSSSEAIDYYQYAFDCGKIKERSRLLSSEDKLRLLESVSFLEKELDDYEYFERISLKKYQDDFIKRRLAGKWIENLVNSPLDIAKIFMALDKMVIPHSYWKFCLGLE